MTAGPPSPRAASSRGLAPYGIALTWLCVAAFGLLGLPLLTVAENRLALGRPVPGLELLGGAGALGIAAGVLGVVWLVQRSGPQPARFAVAAFVLA